MHRAAAAVEENSLLYFGSLTNLLACCLPAREELVHIHTKGMHPCQRTRRFCDHDSRQDFNMEGEEPASSRDLQLSRTLMPGLSLQTMSTYNLRTLTQNPRKQQVLSQTLCLLASSGNTLGGNGQRCDGSGLLVFPFM